MQIIEIKALKNGSHRNQTTDSEIIIPEGWAIIPNEMTIPETFPFVNIEVKDGVVTSMTHGIVPEVEPTVEDDTITLKLTKEQYDKLMSILA